MTAKRSGWALLTCGQMFIRASITSKSSRLSKQMDAQTYPRHKNEGSDSKVKFRLSYSKLGSGSGVEGEKS
jgi:hypothetical protein